MRKRVESQIRRPDEEAVDDEVAEIRYSLTALGEAVVADRKRVQFRGFGPCAMAEYGNPA